MRQQDRSPAYINIHIRAINAFSRWLKAEGHTGHLSVVKQVPNPTRPIPLFSGKDIQRMLAYKPKGFHQHRLSMLIALLLDTGVRIDEALNIREAEVDFDNLLITILGGHPKPAINRHLKTGN